VLTLIIGAQRSLLQLNPDAAWFGDTEVNCITVSPEAYTIQLMKAALIPETRVAYMAKNRVKDYLVAAVLLSDGRTLRLPSHH